MKIIEYAQHLGFITTKGPMLGDPISFRKNNKVIWECYNRQPWVCADLVDEYYVNHRYYKTLEEALNQEK